jgi:hypothetical protein
MRKILLSFLLLCSTLAIGQHKLLASRGGKSVILGSNPVTVFGADCKLWLNTATPANKALAGPEQTRITSLVSDDNNHYLFDFVAAQVHQGVRLNASHKWFYMPSETYLRHNSAATFKLLHDGSSWTMAFRFKPIRPTSTSMVPIFNNNNSTSANTGVHISYDNRSSLTRTHALNVQITKSSAGNFVINLVIDNFFVSNDWVSGVLVYDGTTLTAYKNGVSAGTATRVIAHVTTNSTGVSYVNRLSNTATFGTGSLLKHLIIINRVPTSPELATLNFIIEQGNETIGDRGEKNYHFGWGQSNFDGSSGESNSANLALRNLMDTYMWSSTGRAGVAASPVQFFDFTKWKTNPNPSALGLGPWLSYAKQLSLYDPGSFFSVYAVGGTALQNGLTTPDWNVAGGSTECADQSTNQMIYALDAIQYEYDYTPITRSIIGRLGETDAITGVTTFQQDMYDLMNQWIDAIVAAGYDTSLVRFWFSTVSQDSPTYASPTRPYVGDVDAAYADVAADYFTDNPSKVGFVKGVHVIDMSDIPISSGDFTHWGNTSMKDAGERFFTNEQPYLNEL